MKKRLTQQQKLFIVKQQKVKSIIDENLARKQLASWSRYVDSKVMYRDLIKRNLPFKWMDKYLDKTWYTMTEEIFKLIKEKYEDYEKVY